MKRIKPPSRTAFSMIEVVFALGIVSFALISIFGLFTLGLKTTKESSDEIQAANLASLLISTRRAFPATNLIADFSLPPLTNTTTNVVTGTAIIGIDGKINPSSSLPGADTYRLKYQIELNAETTNVFSVNLLLWWPAALLNAPTNNPGGYYEITTQIALTNSAQ